MKHKFTRKLAVLAVAIASFALFAKANVYAADASDTFSEDTAGNVFGSGESVVLSASDSSKIYNEFFGSGLKVKADNVVIDGCAFMAGQTVSASNSAIKGTVFAAGQDVNISSEVGHNVFVAGQNITTDDTASARAIYAAGANANISGTYDYVCVSADTIYFNATVKGDVTLSGTNITIGDNASVDGVLNVEYTKEQNISDSAKVNTLNSSLVEKDSSTGDVAAKATIGAIILSRFKNFIKDLVKLAVLAVVFAFLLRSNLTEAYELCIKKPGAFWGLGTATLLAFPLAAILLSITIIAIPVAGLGALIYATGLLYAKAFAYSSLVRELIFRHTKKRLHPVAETVLAVLPAAVINLIPVVRGLVGLACALYTMGYITLFIINKIKKECAK